MAIGFDDGSTEKLKYDLASTLAYPCLISAWVYPDSAGDSTNETFVFFGESDDNPRMWIRWTTNDGDIDMATLGTTTTNVRQIISSATQDQWHHIFVYQDASTTRTYGNGTVNYNAGFTAGEPTTIDKGSIGSWYNSTNTVTRLQGRVENAFLWSDVPTLDSDQCQAIATHLSLGGNPRLHYPDKIIAEFLGHWNKDSFIGGTAAETGTPDLLAIANSTQTYW